MLPDDKPNVGLQLNKVAVPDVSKAAVPESIQMLVFKGLTFKTGNGFTTMLRVVALA